MQDLFKGEIDHVFKPEVHVCFHDNEIDETNALIHDQINGDERISKVSNTLVKLESYDGELTDLGYNSCSNSWSCYPPLENVSVVKKRHRQGSTHRRPMLPPCVVCGETSTGFHYGANTCEACKGFFRRNLRKEEVTYECKCTPELREAWKRGPRKNGCQACRYKRCVAVGMSKTAIKLGRYSYNHKTRNIKQAKYIEALNNAKEEIPTFRENSPSSSTSSSSRSQYDGCSPEDSSLALAAHITDVPIGPYDFCDSPSPMKASIRKTTKVHLHDTCISHKELDSIVSIVTEGHLASIQPIDISIETIKKKQDDYLESYKSRQYNQEYRDTSDQMQHVSNIFTVFEEKIVKAVSFAKKIPGFRELHLDDQATLIKASRAELTLFSGFAYLLTHVDTERQVLTTPWGEELHLEELGQVLPVNILMKRYQFAQRIENLKLTSQELSVTRAIVTVASDRCQLVEPGKVDALQQKLVACLQRLLNVRSRGPGTLLYRIFNLITDLRELTEIEGELSKKMLSEWPTVSKDNFYLLKELST